MRSSRHDDAPLRSLIIDKLKPPLNTIKSLLDLVDLQVLARLRQQEIGQMARNGREVQLDVRKAIVDDLERRSNVPQGLEYKMGVTSVMS
jgi:hypothetical protein